MSTTTTTSVAHVPRLQRISVAVLVDGKDGKPRPDAELAHLGELAKRAVGFDADRGDTFEISSSPFVRAEEGPLTPPTPVAVYERPIFRTGMTGLGALVALAIVAMALRGKGGRGASRSDLPITPGSRVAEIEAALARDALPPGSALKALPDPAVGVRERAKELAAKDPTRAAHILKAWMAQEQNSPSNRTTPNA
jgi:flagellar M-ring protein FliF